MLQDEPVPSAQRVDKETSRDRSADVSLIVVRPVWAHSCGWKSRHELVTASEVKRNCVRATERGEEAWSVNRVPMDRNRI